MGHTSNLLPTTAGRYAKATADDAIGAQDAQVPVGNMYRAACLFVAYQP